MTEPVVHFENVCFSYDQQRVLENVCLNISDRDFVSIVGPNGGGKTTLLKLMLGLLRPGSGTARVLGEFPQRICREIGYMPQHWQIDPLFPATVMDVVLMGRIGITPSLGAFRKADREKALQALEQMDMQAVQKHAFSRLSGGQRQRVLIARALACDPKLLLLDEPTANLDVSSENELHEHLAQLSRQRTVMIVSHDLGFVNQYVRTVVCVNRTVRTHPTEEITGVDIQELYGTHSRVVRHDRDNCQ